MVGVELVQDAGWVVAVKLGVEIALELGCVPEVEWV